MPDEASSREVRLDLRGLHCPMPVLRAGKAMRTLPDGATLVLECTDPLTVIDIPHFVAEAGHVLVAQERSDGLFLYRIRRGPSRTAGAGMASRVRHEG